MSEFGEELRKERERRGVALAAITETTKISNRYLVALETGHFNYLPGGIFNKGIVRSYARVVGLNEEAWVSRFMSAYRQSGQLLDDDASWISFAENVGKGRPKGTSRSRLHMNWAGVAVLLVVLAALGWFVWQFVGHKAAVQVSSAGSAIQASSEAGVPEMNSTGKPQCNFG